MNFENTILSDRSQTHGATYCIIPSIGNVQNRQVLGDRKWISDTRGRDRGKGRTGVTVNGDMVSLMHDLVKILSTELYT